METRQSNTKKIVVAVVLVLIIAIGVWYYQQSNLPTTPVVPSVYGTYKDGTYSAIGVYTAPSGPEQVAVSITLKGNIITDATVTNTAKADISKKLQDMFIGGYKTYVVGQNIDTVKLNKISGSSLTPKGFNDALDKIKLQAKA